MSWILAGALSAVACAGFFQPAVITGRVIDPYGQPVAGATVAVVGSTFSAITNEEGSYSLDYAPGRFAVTARKDAYLDAGADLDVSEKVPFPLRDLELIALPPPGVHVLAARAAVEIPVRDFAIQKFKVGWSHCETWRPDGWLPLVSGKALRLIADLPKEDRACVDCPSRPGKWMLLRADDGVVLRDGPDDCGEPHPLTWIEPTAEERSARALLHASVDRTGVYCLVERHQTFLGSETARTRGACFRWAGDAPLADPATTPMAEAAFRSYCMGEGAALVAGADADWLAVTPPSRREGTQVAGVDVSPGVGNGLLALTAGGCVLRVPGVEDTVREDLVAVHRRVGDAWSLLAISRDGATMRTLERDLPAVLGSLDAMEPAPEPAAASQLQPSDGSRPPKNGSYSYRPAPARAFDIVEFHHEAGSVLLHADAKVPARSVPLLEYTGWRVWTVGSDGRVAISPPLVKK